MRVLPIVFMNSHLKKLFTLCFLIGSHQLFLGQNFVSTWNTSSAGGTLSNTEIIIEANESLVYNYDVDWDNDGTFDEFGITGDITHDFGTDGTYTIQIRGTFPAMNFGNDPTNSGHKLSSIDSWGTIEWTTFDGAFTNCSNLVINATDTPDLSKVTSLNDAFRNCTSLDYSFENWDVSNITDMTNMLDGVTLSTSNYDNTLINWSSQSLQTGVVFSAGNSNYCSGQSSKNDIINNFGWNITDAGSDNTILPNAICKDTTISLSGDGIFELNESHLDGGSFHNCSNLTFSVSDPILDCNDANLTVSRTLTVSDDNGNNASCTSNITILDTNTPVIICPSDTTFGANQTGCIGTYT